MLQFIHLTDCHLPDKHNESIRGFNTIDSLSQVIEDIKQRENDYDFLLVTGDISQTGSEQSYILFSNLIQSLNKPVYCLPGNHDKPYLLKKIFPKSPDRAISVNLLNQYLLILLNTHVDGMEFGAVSDDQLKQLENMLSNNQNRPVLIALHHQPININSQWMDNIGLKNAKALLDILEKFNSIKMLLFGHVHQAIDIKHKHINIMATPSTCYQFKPQSKVLLPDELGPGYRVVKLLNNGSVETKVHRIAFQTK